MRSVGFTRAKFYEHIGFLKKDIAENPDKKVVFSYEDGGLFVELYKLYGNGIGLLARGLMDDNENIKIESFEAFALYEKDLSVNKYVVEFADNLPLIVFEDIGTGNELVFALQNRIDFFKDEQRFINHGRSVIFSKDEGIVKRRVNFTAFSSYGQVILPVHKPSKMVVSKDGEPSEKAASVKFDASDEFSIELMKKYIDQASGDADSRLLSEDLFSVIEGFFLPMEMNDTEYSMLGEIEAVEEVINPITDEIITRLSLNITGTKLMLIINKRDLIGYPMAGMRFMGTCRMRGIVLI